MNQASRMIVRERPRKMTGKHSRDQLGGKDNIHRILRIQQSQQSVAFPRTNLTVFPLCCALLGEKHTNTQKIPKWTDSENRKKTDESKLYSTLTVRTGRRPMDPDCSVCRLRRCVGN